MSENRLLTHERFPSYVKPILPELQHEPHVLSASQLCRTSIWTARRVSRGSSGYRGLGGYGPTFQLFGYMAAHHQYGNNDCHLSNGVHHSKYPKSRRSRFASKVG